MTLLKHASRLLLAGAAACAALTASAQTSLLDLARVPLYVGANVQPLVMLALSKDQQLYKKAYNDYSDLDGDGALELTYKHAINYYGYFDPYKCYNYVTANKRFEPVYDTSALTAANQKYCDTATAEWSGNFLNWASMSRMDAVRKLLYGGLRSPTRGASSDGNGIADGDSATSTVLERAFIPTDAHAWVKYYAGSDIARLTPITPVSVTTTGTSATAVTIGTGSRVLTVSATTGFANGDFVEFYLTADPTTYMRGTITNVQSGPARLTISPTVINLGANVGTAYASSLFSVRDIRKSGVSICNVTLGDASVGNFSQTNTNLPRIRVAKGNYSLWSANERTQCYWSGEQARSNGNNFTQSGIPAFSSNPDITVDGNGTGLGDYFVRIQACVSTLIGTEKCKQYPSGNYKPIGLLQQYGDVGLLQFGLMTGSNRKNVSGGVLRKNTGSFLDEVNATTDGTFKSAPTNGGIVDSLNKMRIWGYYYGLPGASGNDGYLGGNGDNCTYQLTSITENSCTAWGNPMSEIYYEALRYFAGGKPLVSGVPQPTPAYTYGSFSLAGSLGSNPIQTTNGSATVTITQTAHGLSVGDSVTLAGATNVGGRTINGSYTVASIVDANRYRITIAANATSSQTGGGSAATYVDNYVTTSGAKDVTTTGPYAAGLPLPAWADPLSQNTYCAPLNVVLFNASVSTTDNDQIPTGSTKSYLGTLALSSSFSSAMAAKTVAGWTNDVGAGENIHGNAYFIGRNGTTNDEYCTAKTVSALADISGICPEGPTLSGSYLMSGLAYASHISRIRSDLTVPATNARALKIDTYAVQLATNVPQILVTLTGTATPKAVIQPTYRLNNAAPQGGGALVEMRIISLEQGTNYSKGRVYINWEDSEQGGDYDSDVWGVMSWCLQTTITTACPGQALNTITVTTDAVAQATGNPQGFGYTISGTTQDGPHFHSGIFNFTFTDSTNISVPAGTFGNAATATLAGYLGTSGGCGGTNGCQLADGPTTAYYSLGSSVGNALKDPLWYAAKWGGFKETGTGGNNLPDLSAEWDQRDANGNAVSDGVPDNYFLVSNPLGLESALDKAFVAILTTSSASSVATNSTSLNTGSRIFQARFNSNDWSGQLLSFTIDLNGVIASVEEWDSGQKINSQDGNSTSTFPTGRSIATYQIPISGTKSGIPFRWAGLSTAQQTALNTNIANVNDSLGSSRLDWIRGSAVNEGLAASNFRRRITSKLGDIVNSNPQFVGPPSGPYTDAAYLTFKSDNASRPSAIYVGANDGMLHAFDASTDATKQGKEIFAYVPSNVYYKLPWLTAQNYSHRFFVDGTPTVADAYVNGVWKTVLASTQGAGGQSVFALDVTSPYSNTEATASSWVMWEFKDSDSGGRLGNVYGYPVIAKMNNGKWAVIVSSGYNNSFACATLPCSTGGDYIDTDSSTTGRAYLFILFIENGVNTGGNWVQNTDYIRLSTLTGTVTAPNGLASPLVVDVDGDGMADYIYAGDLYGNFWKFDVTSTTATTWDVAFYSAGTPKPLYVAKDPSGANQIITAPAALLNHPSGGYMLYFGTGRYLQTIDPNSPYSVNTFYGVWDWQTKLTVDSAINPSAGRISSSVTTRNSTLLQLQDTIATVVVGGIDFRVTTDNTVNWATQRGWYWDFPSSGSTGERMVVGPIVRNGKAIITTLVPSTTSCDAGGAGFLTDLDALSGSRLTESPFDVNGNNNFSTADFVTVTIAGVPTSVAVSSRKSQVGITPMPTVISGGPGKEFKVTSGSTGGRESILENPGGATTATFPTRRSWREILQN